MRILKDEHLDAPISMAPGDQLELTYTPPHRAEQVLLTSDFTEAAVIDYVAAFQLDDDELKRLGLAKAIGGLFGAKV